MADSKQYPNPYGGYGGVPQQGYGGVPQQGYGGVPQQGYTVGGPAPGGFPQTGFAGPGYPGAAPAGGGYSAYPIPPQGGFSNPGYGGGAAPPMGFLIPPQGAGEERPKPYSNESGSSYGDVEGMDFSERTIRMAFIRKVYGLLSMQLLLTTAIIALFSFHVGVKGWVRSNPAFTIGSYVIAIVLMIAMACCESVRRKAPMNLIFLGLFTLTYGIVVGVIASSYNIQSVVIAAGVTVAICVGLTLFSFQTKYDFTMMGGALFCVFMVFFLFGIIAMFVRIPALQMILAGFGAILFSCYLVYDTQIMLGGKHKYAISPEEYIFAALNLYMDVVMIFLYILQLLGSRGD